MTTVCGRATLIAQLSRQSEGGTVKTDNELNTDVEEEPRCDPDLEPNDIRVTVKNGVVSLSGFAHSCYEKIQGESDARRGS
jgi:osmotically-inducible protein OsmY